MTLIVVIRRVRRARRFVNRDRGRRGRHRTSWYQDRRKAGQKHECRHQTAESGSPSTHTHSPLTLCADLRRFASCGGDTDSIAAFSGGLLSYIAKIEGAV